MLDFSVFPDFRLHGDGLCELIRISLVQWADTACNQSATSGWWL